MIRFRTELKLPDFPFSLKYTDGILCMGSCFAENIASRLNEYKFSTLLNPFGIQYNPFSLSKSIKRLVDGRTYTEGDIFYANGIWQSFDHHSKFAALTAEKYLEQINESISTGHKFINKASFLILTFGTSFVFEHLERNQIVANCHKLPGNYFRRRKLSIEEIIMNTQSMLDLLFKVNPNIKILLTVSPIRHIRDGLTENQRSKARLLVATEALCKNNKNVYYFPSYELLMDDLRDYRFYDIDLIHPNKMAVDYIWEQFTKAFIQESEHNIMAEVFQIIQASKHRPFNEKREQHQQFLKAQVRKIESIESKHPFLNFKVEKDLFKKQLI